MTCGTVSTCVMRATAAASEAPIPPASAAATIDARADAILELGPDAIHPNAQSVEWNVELTRQLVALRDFGTALLLMILGHDFQLLSRQALHATVEAVQTHFL